MKYLIAFFCLLFCTSAIAQSDKPLTVLCIKGDSLKGHPTISSVDLHNSDPKDLAEQIWNINLKGKRIFNFRWEQKDGSKLDLTKNFIVRYVSITLDNNSIVVLYPISGSRIEQKKFLWVQSGMSIDQLKQFISHKMVSIVLVADDNLQYPLFSFSKSQQAAIRGASKCFLSNIQ